MLRSRSSEEWLERLRPEHPHHDQTVGKLRKLLVRVAFHELSRRRGQLASISGPELEDLANQAAAGALMSVLDTLDEFRGLSRFTTWAYKFVMFEISTKVARHTWGRETPGREQPALDPRDRLDQPEQFQVLSAAIDKLTERQREVFVAIAEDGDIGCGAAAEILDAYVELKLAGEHPARVHPGLTIHLESCPACWGNHDGLLEAARRCADALPE